MRKNQALTSLRARFVFPVDRPPIEHGVVTLDGERIVAVGKEPVGGEVHELGAVALIPGLVNAHTHLEFSHLRRPLGAPGMPLTDWIRLVIDERGRRVRETCATIAAGTRESLQYGVTTIGEINTAGDLASYDGIDAALFIEVIGFSRARAASAFAAGIARLDQLRQAGGAHVGICPHAPYTVSPELLLRLVNLVSQQGLAVAMHLGESEEEIEFLATGQGVFQQLLDERGMWDAAAIPRGSRPIDYLRPLSKAPRSLVIHGNFLDAQERAFLAAHRERMSLVYCPRTHDYFAHPLYPLADLLAEGANVALGTDSRASNPDLNLLAEMRHVARNHCAVYPSEILRLGTIAGAIAIGRADEVGSITPGKSANLIAMSLPNSTRTTAEDVLAGILFEEPAPSEVWFRGSRLSQR